MNTLVFQSYHAIVLAAVFALGAAMPWLTRKDIVFGVRLPEDFAAGEAVRHLRRSYLNAYLAAAAVAVVLLAAQSVVWPMLKYDGFDVLAVVALMTAFYWAYRAKTLRLKADSRVMAGRVQVTVAEIGPLAPENLVSWAWFLLPLGLAGANALLGLWRYPNLPDRIPMHFGADGLPNSWAHKSVGVVLLMPVIQFVTAAVLMVSFWGVRHSKRQLSPQRPAESARQQALFRRAWSIFIVAAAILTMLTMSVIFWVMVGFVRLCPDAMMAATLGPSAIVIVYAIVLSVRLGQSGSRAAVAASDAGDNPTAVARDDDRFWKAGLFYCNPDDPAVFLEKRFGIGYTVNFANPKAWLFIALPLVLIVVALLLTRF
jgi:uncharacterized membrane protein